MKAQKIRRYFFLQSILTEVNCNLGTLKFYRLLPAVMPILFYPPYVLKLHADRKPLADFFIRKGWINPTFIYRDPRDALLSAYEYGQRMSKKAPKNAFTPLTTIEKAIDFIDMYVEIARHWISCDHVLKVRYEDLLTQYSGEVRRLCSFLNIDETDLAVEKVISQYRPAQGEYDQQGMHFVKGKIGRYQKHFSPQQLELCKQKFGDFLIEHDYDV